MKMKKTVCAVLVVLSAFLTGKVATAQDHKIKTSYKTDIHIISGNDMHATIENFPQLGAIVDSMRRIDKNTLVISAGDNRTGNPLNDIYSDPSYPMVALMNQIGFDCTTFGNHEFDSGQEGLARNINESSFPYICANIFPDPQTGIQTVPYKFFDIKGVKICILGVVETDSKGKPSTHPKNVEDISFAPVEQTIRRYIWLRDECDVFILLSHIGYDADTLMASKFPQFDLIIGGHSHTQIDGGELHNGVLITQNVNKLKRVTHTILTVENGKVTGKSASNIEVAGYPRKNTAVKALVDFFSNNPEFQKVLAQAEAPFSSYEELGIMMCDALRVMGQTDVAISNAGGVRYDSHPAGDFTVNDVLRLDPFGNTAVVMNITGQELRDMIISCFHNDTYGLPFMSGITCQATYADSNRSDIKDLKLFDMEGKPLNLKKKFKVITNSYTAVICDAPRSDQGEDINRQTADMLMEYLQKMQKVNYQGRRCISEIF